MPRPSPARPRSAVRRKTTSVTLPRSAPPTTNAPLAGRCPCDDGHDVVPCEPSFLTSCDRGSSPMHLLLERHVTPTASRRTQRLWERTSMRFNTKKLVVNAAGLALIGAAAVA